MNQSEYIRQILTEFAEKVNKSKEMVKIYCVISSSARAGGKTYNIIKALEASGLRVAMINSKDEIQIINGENAILIDENKLEPEEQESGLEKLNEAVAQLHLYERAPHSAEDIIRSQILHQNKIDRDQARFRKRYQRKNYK